MTHNRTVRSWPLTALLWICIYSLGSYDRGGCYRHWLILVNVFHICSRVHAAHISQHANRFSGLNANRKLSEVFADVIFFFNSPTQTMLTLQ